MFAEFAVLRRPFWDCPKSPFYGGHPKTNFSSYLYPQKLRFPILTVFASLTVAVWLQE